MIRPIQLMLISFCSLFLSSMSLVAHHNTNEDLKGPVVWTVPEFPTQTDDITLYFDAKEGNGELAGFTGTVYAHAGVITSQSTAPNDWKHVQGQWGVADARTKMKDEGNDIYSLSYNITDFYGINAGEVVEQLAFVFRNATGTLVGRAADGADIYLDVYPPDDGLLVNLIAPQNNYNILCEGDDLLIDLMINKASSIEIIDNGLSVYTETAERVSYTLTSPAVGPHIVEIIIADGEESQTLSLEFLVLADNPFPKDPPSGIRDGVNDHTASSFIFQLTAPRKKNVFLLCPANNFKVDLDYQMESRDGQTFWIELSKEIFDNGQNTYQYLVDGNIKIADPYSEVILDPANDGGVPADVLAELPAYPEGATGIVTVFDMEDSNFAWTDSNFVKPEKSNLVIYEIMMRDFLADKNYKSLLDTLTYLEDLGINAIELMPINEFEGNQSWGYNPSFHMAVDKYYGSRHQLKAVIDACHAKGIAVILDVVFNHAFSQSPLCQLYWDQGSFRPSADSPYLNVTARHPYNVGYDFNHESRYTKDWVKRNLSYWTEEFHFDGFRFDLSKGLTQTNSGNNGALMSQYDQSRIDILKEYASHIWGMDQNAYVIMEHFADNTEEIVLSEAGMMLWGNMTHDFAEAAMGYSSNLEWADYSHRGWSEPHLIAYMESHDEERMGYKLKTYGNSNGNYNTKNLTTATERVAAASAVYFSIPGPKMLWQFGELAYDNSINLCTNGSINNNCRLNPKPILWNYFQTNQRKDLYDRLSALIDLKTHYPTFSTRDFSFDDSDAYVKKVYLNHPDMDAVTLANFAVTDNELDLEFPHTGLWYEYFTGDILDVSSPSHKLTLKPGAYKIYTSEQLTPPGGYFMTATVNLDAQAYNSYPNPISVGETLMIELGDHRLKDLWLTDLTGTRLSLSYDTFGHQIFLQTDQLVAGSYFLSLDLGPDGLYNQNIILME